MNKPKQLWPALIMLVLMSGCAQGGSKVMLGCPPIVNYSEEDQTRLADELKSVPGESMIWTFLRDYATEREMLRACRP